MALYSSLEGMADNIVEVVRRMFFYYVYDKDTIDDLRQEGYLIIYELLEKGLYDPSKNLRNYLFTGVRNAMTNYMHRVNKTKNDISYDQLEDAQWQDYMEVVNDDYYAGKVFTYMQYQIESSIDDNDLLDVISRYRNYGNNLKEKFLNKYGKILALKTDEKINDEDEQVPLVYNAIMGELVWKKVLNEIA